SATHATHAPFAHTGVGATHGGSQLPARSGPIATARSAGRMSPSGTQPLSAQRNPVGQSGVHTNVASPPPQPATATHATTQARTNPIRRVYAKPPGARSGARRRARCTIA